MTEKRGKKRVAEALMAQERYGKTTKGNAKHVKGKTKIKPKGNWFKGNFGFEVNKTF